MLDENDESLRLIKLIIYNTFINLIIFINSISYLLGFVFSAGAGSSFFYVKDSFALVSTAKSASSVRSERFFAFWASVKRRFV